VRTALAGFVVGVILLQCSPSLISPLWILAGALLAIGFALLLQSSWPSILKSCGVGILAAALGFVYADLRAHWRMSETLPHEWEGQALVLTGTITELPTAVLNGQRFIFSVEYVDPVEAVVPHKISLAWFNTEGGATIPPLHPGQRWRLRVSLKRPHSLINPGGFDFEAWSLAQGVRATGAVRDDPDNQLLQPSNQFNVATPGIVIEQARDVVRARIQAALGDRRWTGVIIALVVGDQSQIRQEDWQLFWQTGVGHLISISGLHITLLAGLVASAVRRVWPGVRLHWWVMLTAATAYALLAGFSVPTQRTLYMIAVVTMGRLRDLPLEASPLLLCALVVAVVIDPWAPVSIGFWLSFGAVGVLMFAHAHVVGRSSAWRAAIHTQWSATWALVPLMVLLFQQVSLISPLANAFAIPLVSLAVVPLSLLGVIPGLGWLLIVAHAIFSNCAWALQQLAAGPVTVWSTAAPTVSTLTLGFIGLLFLLAPRGLPGRRVGALCLVPLLFTPAPRPEWGGVWMDVLDVGQGLAVVLRTQHHNLIYDSGPRYSSENDGGARIVLPALRAMGVAHVDGLIISHRDTDHSGGGLSLQKGIAIDWLLSSLEHTHPIVLQAKQSITCYAGQAWQWEGVDFEIIHPLRENALDETRKTNDRGCVLRISAEGKHLLLPADIEAVSEREILQRNPHVLTAEVLIAPHHGSKTSSTEEFIDAVAPLWTIFTVGYRNHFGHPKDEIVQRYVEHRSGQMRTDESGAVAIQIEQEIIKLTAERDRFPHYWSDALTPAP